MRTELLTRVLKSYDKMLKAKRDDHGVVNIYREVNTYDVFDFDGGKLWSTRKFDMHVMSLTDTWNANGQPVEWGAEPILCRIKAMDLWNNPTLLDDLKNAREKSEEGKQRDFRNNVESFLYDFRSQFAKATNGINTSTLEKIDKRRLQDGIN